MGSVKRPLRYRTAPRTSLRAYHHTRGMEHPSCDATCRRYAPHLWLVEATCLASLHSQPERVLTLPMQSQRRLEVAVLWMPAQAETQLTQLVACSVNMPSMMRMKKTREIKFRHTEMMPKIFPTVVIDSPVGSICPAFIAAKSWLAITQATTPKMTQTKKERIPKTRIKTPRCGGKFPDCVPSSFMSKRPLLAFYGKHSYPWFTCIPPRQPLSVESLGPQRYNQMRQDASLRRRSPSTTG